MVTKIKSDKELATRTEEQFVGNASIVKSGDLGVIFEEQPQVEKVAFSNYVRSLMQNWRQGTVGAKSRGEVSFSNKKPWKQKGTGRARAGSRRSPLWRKGGVVFPPQERVRKLKISQDQKRSIHGALLWKHLEEGRIRSFDAVFNDKPKTSAASKLLKEAGLKDKKVLLFVQPHDVVVQASFSNIPNVQLIVFDEPNAYLLAGNEYWAILNKDLEAFKDMVKAWI